ncbi:MAG: hypothetical protein M1834_006334 [Cirrosporium novae-zelandiae]|nr:MAG: hypothetical protein M1834_006334 [Cirrosporium novae-zelandiae]
MPVVSPFLHLPTEVRLMIYRHVLNIYPNTRLFIPSPQNCREEILTRSPYPLTLYGERESFDSEISQIVGYHTYRVGPRLDLFAVCRAISHEAVPLFYSETFFAFKSPRSFLACLSHISSDARTTIRHMELELELKDKCWTLCPNGRTSPKTEEALIELATFKSLTTLEIMIPDRDLGILLSVFKEDNTDPTWIGNMPKLDSIRSNTKVGDIRWIFSQKDAFDPGPKDMEHLVAEMIRQYEMLLDEDEDVSESEEADFENRKFRSPPQLDEYRDD